jgi:thiamine biosynthesis lipoprotein
MMNRYKKGWIAALVVMLAAAALTLTGCGKKTDPVSQESYYFDTVCQLTVYDMKDMSEKHADEVIQGAFRQCDKYEKLLSKTKKGSDIYKVNHAGGRAVTCDPVTIKVLQKGIRYGKMTDGLFDITVGQAEDLYDFHDKKHHTVPTDAQLAQAVSHINYQNVQISGREVSLTDPDSEIDLGGIAKGYIADRLGVWMKKQGVTSAIISLGGNITCVGGKDGSAFKVGIEKPFSDQSEVVGYTKAKEQTVVTSGVYERYFRKNGRLYHHILDPSTGRPADTDVYSVTIVAGSGRSIDCDAMATICLLMGKEKGMDFIEKQDGCQALFIDKDGKITKTKGMNFTKQEEDK